MARRIKIARREERRVEFLAKDAGKDDAEGRINRERGLMMQLFGLEDYSYSKRDTKEEKEEKLEEEISRIEVNRKFIVRRKDIEESDK